MTTDDTMITDDTVAITKESAGAGSNPGPSGAAAVAGRRSTGPAGGRHAAGTGRRSATAGSGGTRAAGAGGAPAAAPRGRPRDDGLDGAILDAALELLGETGYERMSMDAIAGRAHVSKATIYRRWSGKSDLVVEALRRRVVTEQVLADCGSLEADLVLAARHVCRQVAGIDGCLLVGLAAAARHDPEVAAGIRSLSEAGPDLLAGAVARAVERGELGPAAVSAGAAAAEALAGLAVFHALHTTPLDDRLALHLARDVALPLLRGAGASSPVATPGAPERGPCG